MRRRFFCNSHALLGESRGYCTKAKQEWPDSGSTLENIFCNFYEINSSQAFFCVLQNFGVDGKDTVLRRVLRRERFIERRLEGRNASFRRPRPPSRAPYEGLRLLAMGLKSPAIHKDLGKSRAEVHSSNCCTRSACHSRIRNSRTNTIPTIGNGRNTVSIVPLARNQYTNNSPGVFSSIRAGANTGATCIRTEMNSLKNLADMRTVIPQKYFPVFARARIQAPHVFARKLIPQEMFPACLGFVPGGDCFRRDDKRAHFERALKVFVIEWPRQTKPKKGQFMNFSQGHSGTKVQCESCLFS